MIIGIISVTFLDIGLGNWAVHGRQSLSRKVEDKVTI